MLFNEMLVDTTIDSLEAGRVPALMGEPGIGKSSFVEDVARRTNTRCFTLPCNLLADKADLTGAGPRSSSHTTPSPRRLVTPRTIRMNNPFCSWMKLIALLPTLPRVPLPW